MTAALTFAETLGARPGRYGRLCSVELKSVAEDLEYHCRALGQELLASEGEVPDWLLDDVYLALVGQGVMTE